MNSIQSLILLTLIFSSFAGILVYWVFHRENDLSAKYWTYGCACYFVGLFLIAIRPYLPGFVAYSITNFLLIYPLVLFVYSFRALANKAIDHPGRPELMLAIYALSLEVVNQVGFGMYRTLIAAVVWILACLWVFIELQKLKEQIQNKFLTLFKYLVLLSAFSWFVRLVVILETQLHDLTEVTTLNLVSFVMIYILMFAHQYLYLIIRLTDEKSQKNKIESLNQSLRESVIEKNDLKKHATGLESSLLSVLNSLAMERDNETGNHIIRTQNYVKILAQRLLSLGKLEASTEFIDMIYRAAPLHDIGKIGIPDSILLKPGRLTDEEWAVMKTHASIGENVLSTANQEHQIDSKLIKIATEIAGGHHENWDGSGYPKGLAGNAIPQSARIMAVADTYDALVSRRVYKNEWTHDEAVQEVIKQRGIKFDPEVIDAFLLEANEFNAVAQRYKD